MQCKSEKDLYKCQIVERIHNLLLVPCPNHAQNSRLTENGSLSGFIGAKLHGQMQLETSTGTHDTVFVLGFGRIPEYLTKWIENMVQVTVMQVPSRVTIRDITEYSCLF